MLISDQTYWGICWGITNVKLIFGCCISKSRVFSVMNLDRYYNLYSLTLPVNLPAHTQETCFEKFFIFFRFTKKNCPYAPKEIENDSMLRYLLLEHQIASG